MTKKRKIHLKTDQDTDQKTENQNRQKGQPDSSSKPQENKLAINIFYTAFAVLFVFFLFSGYMAYRAGAFSHVLFLTFALGGFLIAALSRRLSESGYFLFYRILAIVFFLIIGGALYFIESLDGFLTALLCITAASVILGAFLPFIFKEIPPERIALISGSVMAVGLTLMVMTGNRNEIRRRPTINFPDRNYMAMVFDEEGKDSYIISDDWFFINAEGTKKDQTVKFSVIRKDHPLKFLEDRAKKEMEDLKNFSGNKGNKKAPAANLPADEDMLFSYQGSGFSWSFIPGGSLVAVAGAGEKSGQNSLFMLDFKEKRRIDIDGGADRVFYFPWKSRTYADYSTWSHDGSSFFAFLETGGKTRLIIADTKAGKKLELDRDDVLSAFWAWDGTLFIVCGTKKPIDHLMPSEEKLKAAKLLNFGVFDFAPEKVELYRWSPGSEKAEKFNLAFPDKIAAIKVHPRSGRLFAFDGQKVYRFGGTGGFEESAFPCLPDPEETAISPDGTKILLKSSNQVLLWDMEKGTSKALGSTTRHLRHITFGIDGKHILYAECSDFNLWLFHCLYKVYSVEDSRLSQFVPNFPTASVRASTSFPYSFYVDSNRGLLCFDQKSFQKKFFKEPVASTTIWLLNPPLIELKPEPEPSPSPSTSPSPEASPSPSPSVVVVTPPPGTPVPFTGASPLPTP